jgi:lipopolysaccharide export LptBFGC system permease protein LptF
VRYLPIIVLSFGLVAIVMAMAGNREKSLRTGVGIGIVVIALIVMAALFAIVVRRTLGS